MKLSPRTANTNKEILKLKSDNKSTRDAWILLDGNKVNICNQRNGHKATGFVKISKKQFNQLIDWYNKEQ